MIGASAVAVVALVAAGSAGPAARAEEPPPAAIPFAFELPATNGYTATILAGFNSTLDQGAAIFTLRRKGSSAAYTTRSVTIGQDSVEARFGAMGEIDVHSVATGGTSTERSECGGKPQEFTAGRWEGTIRFHGEGGFAAVEASSAKAVVAPFLDLLCFEEGSEGIGAHSPGAHLQVRRHDSAEALELSVRKNSRVRPTQIEVDDSEHRGGLDIYRRVAVVASSHAFDFEIPPGLATVAPPKPFTGSLSLVRHPGSRPHVSGDLKVSLPGRAAVPILGPGSLRASLIRAVLNPSHHF
ncbi:MAG TPA: hypothetical protein VHA76_09535 [Solirubrobacterales bacterium]|nr:hypothetical protein [Solirubrobacterales bacterium]